MTDDLSLADFSWCPRMASGMTALPSVFCLSSKMPCSQSCSSFKLPHINLRTTQKSTSSSNWHMWFENNAQNKCTHKKWKKRWTWDSDGWFSSITAKQKGPQKTPCCGVGRPTAIHFLFNPWDVWKLRGKEKRKALCLKYTLTKILPL